MTTAVLRSELTDPAVNAIIEDTASSAHEVIGGRLTPRGGRGESPFRSELLPTRADLVRRARDLADEMQEAGDPVSIMLLSGGDSTASESTATPDANAPSTSPEQALALYVERRLSQGFVANCDDAERPQDTGKQCARLRGERDGMRAYELGPTFGEYTRLIILQPANDTWTIAVLENRDPNGPPVPGVPVGGDVSS